MKKYLATVGVGLLLIGCGVGSKANEDDNNRLNEHVNSSSDPSAPVVKDKQQIGSGDWEVGKKDNISGGVISPGTYSVIATDDSFGCYWETVRNFDKQGDYIIANGNIDPGHSGIVVVKSSYAGLSLQGGCLAKKKVK